MEPVGDILQLLNPNTNNTQYVESEPVVPLGRAGCYVEWYPSSSIKDEEEMLNLSENKAILLTVPHYGIVVDYLWREFSGPDGSHSGWSYLVQEVDASSGNQITGNMWWLDEEDLTFTGALRRRVPDASQVEIFEPPADAGEPLDFSTTTPLWYRAAHEEGWGGLE